MKKSLVAVAAMMAAGAYAQSGVTIYGNLDQGIYRQTDNGVTYSKLASNVNTTSVLGFRGAEDLGGGKSAGFHLLSELSLPEGQVGSTTSGNAVTSNGQKANLFTRAANVYLEDASLGRFEIGRLQDSVWQTQGAFNNTASNSFGWSALAATQTNFGALVCQGWGKTPADSTFWGTGAQTVGLVAGSGVGGLLNGTTGKYSAAVVSQGTGNNAMSGSAPINFAGGWSYATPTFMGFKATYQNLNTNWGNDSANTWAAQGQSLRLEYTNGPLNVQYAQSSRQDQSFNANAGKWTVIGATYQLGALKLVAAQTKLAVSGGFATGTAQSTAVSASTGSLTVTSAVPTGTAIDGNTITGLGALYDVSANLNVALAYTTMKDNTNTALQTNLTAITARYNLSKRTNVYAGLGKGSNSGANNKATMFYGGPSYTSAAAGSSTGMLVGIRHQF